MEFKAFYEKICQMVRPQSFPIGVKFVKDSNKLTEAAVRPSKYGIKISICRWITIA